MLGFYDVVLGFDDVVLGFYDVVLCFDDVVLCFDDVMRSRHDVMFRFADVVLCFDVVRPEQMDVTQETQRGIFRGASRRCCSFACLLPSLSSLLQKPTSKDTNTKQKRLQTKKQQLLRASGVRMAVVNQKLVLASPAIEFFAALRAAFPFPRYK